MRQAVSTEPADVAALALLRYTWCVDEGGESGEPAGFAAAFGAWWTEHESTHRAWLAERRGEPVGMAWLGLLHRVPGPERFRRVSGNVQSVYVLPTERGAGTGALLVEAVVAHARADGLGYLTVHPSELSYPLYERAGFAVSSGVLELGLAEPRQLRGVQRHAGARPLGAAPARRAHRAE